jgi:hypothetical protein
MYAEMTNSAGSKDDYCAKVKKALERSLGLLGEPSKEVILYHLQQRYKITLGDRVEGSQCSSLEEIETALNTLLGNSSHIIINLIKNEVGDFVNRKTGVC